MNFERLFLFLFIFFCVFFFVFFLSVLIFLFRDFFFVALGLHQRRGLVGQQCGIDAGRIDVKVVEFVAAEFEIEVAVGKEVQVTTLGIENRLVIVGQSVADRDRRIEIGRPEPDLLHAVFRHDHVRQPFGIRRPAIVLDVVALRTVDFGAFATVGVDDPELLVLVGVGDRGSVRRPLDTELPDRCVIGQLFDRCVSVGVGCGAACVQFVFAAGIAPVGDTGTVRRPVRIAFADPGRAGQVADLAVFGGHAEQVTAGAEQHSFGTRSEIGADDVFGSVHKAGEHGRKIADQLHVQLGRATGGRVEDVQVATRLVDDSFTVAARPEHVVVLVMCGLGDRLRFRIQRVQIEHAATIGGEVDRVTDPGRLVVGGGVVGQLGADVLFQVVGPDILGATASITLPGAEFT